MLDKWIKSYEFVWLGTIKTTSETKIENKNLTVYIVSKIHLFSLTKIKNGLIEAWTPNFLKYKYV
jgi:hypothetical protein